MQSPPTIRARTPDWAALRPAHSVNVWALLSGLLP